MKIHNPNNLDVEVDLSALRAMVRGDVDPVRQAIEDRKETTLPARPARTQEENPGKNRSRPAEKPASANFPAPKASAMPARRADADVPAKERSRQKHPDGIRKHLSEKIQIGQSSSHAGAGNPGLRGPGGR